MTAQPRRPSASGSITDPDEVIQIAYERIRAIAGGLMRNERTDHTLQATALANEAFWRLLKGGKSLDELLGPMPSEPGAQQDLWCGRLISLATRRMRHILVDHARGKDSDKRPPRSQRVAEMPDLAETQCMDPGLLIAIDEALTELAALSERQAEVVELMFFGGLTVREAAKVLGIGFDTTRDHWRIARSWLNLRLREEPPPEGAGV